MSSIRKELCRKKNWTGAFIFLLILIPFVCICIHGHRCEVRRAIDLVGYEGDPDNVHTLYYPSRAIHSGLVLPDSNGDVFDVVLVLKDGTELGFFYKS